MNAASPTAVVLGNPRTGEKVWRNSYYEGQIEDRIWRPFAGGNIRGAKRRIGAVLKAARTLEWRTRRELQRTRPGARNGILGQIGLDVLEVLYNQFLDYRTGRLDPAVSTIAAAIGRSYAATHAALKRLADKGFLKWMRRSRPLEKKGEAGPQIEQITNAYVLFLPTALETLVKRLLGGGPQPDDDNWAREERKRELDTMLTQLSATAFLEATWNGDRLAGESLARIAAMLDERESQNARVTRDF